MVTITAWVKEPNGGGAVRTSVAGQPTDEAEAPSAAGLLRGRLLKNVALADLPAMLTREDHYLWIDMEAATEEETLILSNVFHFHPLAIEDCIFDHPYPKVDEYPGYVYLVMHGMRPLSEYEGEELTLKTRELDVFLGPRYLLTFHSEQMRSIDRTRALLEKNTDSIARGPAFLLHRVLDYLVDHYIPVMDDLDRRIDALEAAISNPDVQEVVTRVFSLRQHVSEIRRLSSRQREVLARIARGELALIDHATSLYFRDIFDHIVRVADQAETYRELCSSLIEIALARTSNRLNSIMKTLTLVNTIFLPLTFVTGVYGMNFDALPGKTAQYGFWITLGAMAVGAMTMLFVYRKKRWL